ncbi:sulfurtransferase [Zavarzinia compransoris]|uniref:Sulfurtransferase n=1 Tax=Zavarzinia compransoris TaxID=1264899 RepID=A0A317DXU0_9PROT|nr:sulfurtransferase [Zavarzinia compransoris]PWR17793.1 sulfurtransferase [Zavarzinia compransoris]TDP49323.1 thiosulfate/3-mercaptopyruvate sulfurtransferase [Zavarzinia compransoris]
MNIRQSLVRIVSAATLMITTAVAAQAADGPLVSTDWLTQNLKDPKVRVLEVSVVPGVYEKGHIPGAVNIVWHTDLVDKVQRDIVSKDGFEALTARAGINDDTTIVLYGDNNNWFAAWGAWILSYYGVDDVKILDGGRKKWEAEGRPLDTATPTPAAGTFKVKDTNPALRARLTDVLAVVEKQKDAQILDIRSPDEYSGKIFAPPNSQELAVRAGHVPGAVNVPWSKAVNEDGTFKSKDELKALYASVGVDGSKPVIVYCRIGERSAHTWFALSKILGYEVKQYDGSWTEYGNAVGVPIVNVAGTVWGGK